MKQTSILKRILTAFWELFHIFFRHYNFPCQLGLRRIGNPDDQSPIFLSGNYTLVVHRLTRALKGTHCWLLVANSKGSNVWCAAGMNEFNEHDVIDAVSVSQLALVTRNRTIIAPPYSAPGIDTEKVRTETGFRVQWGPVHLDDLPAYIRAGFRRSEAMTKVRFGMADRMEQALSTSLAYSLTLSPVVFFSLRFFFGLVAIVFLVFLFWFGTWDLFPQERHRAKTLATMFTLGGALALFGLTRGWTWSTHIWWMLTLQTVIVLTAMDGCGSSVLYKTTVLSWLRRGDYRSIFSPVVDPILCVGCIKCLHVCPKHVLARAPTGKVVAVAPDACIECLACMKQCVQKALFNRSGRYKGDVKSIDGLGELMTRSCQHLQEEDRWIGASTDFRKGVPWIVPAAEGEPAAMSAAERA